MKYRDYNLNVSVGNYHLRLLLLMDGWKPIALRVRCLVPNPKPEYLNGRKVPASVEKKRWEINKMALFTHGMFGHNEEVRRQFTKVKDIKF